MSLLSRTMLLLISLSLSHCAPQLWAKPGGTPAEFESAQAICNTQSYGMFPPLYQQVMVSPGYFTPPQATCYGGGFSSNCYTTGGYYVPPTFVPVDQNQGARSSALRSCLMAAGWQPVKDKEEAALVTNALPASQVVPGGAGWEAARSQCRAEAGTQAGSDSSRFAGAFDSCMKARGL